jgi:hypothetical protein
MALRRALSVNDIRKFKPNTLPFEGEWQESIGCPELTGTWIIWGNSSNGKTRFALQLAKYLSRYVRVAYNSLEEGLSASLQNAILDIGFDDVERNVMFLDKEPLDSLKIRLAKRRSPQVIIIDSLQYTGLKYKEYIDLKDGFRNKLFIFISHADGKEPKGEVARSVKYDAFVKILVEGFKAFPQSRFGGGSPYLIWDKGAEKFWDLK